MWLSIIATLLISCSRETFYLSSLDGTVPVYRPTISRSDSIKSAVDLSGSFAIGSANKEKDETFFFNGSISRSHVTRSMGFRYGLNVATGTYKIAPVNVSRYYPTNDEDYINANAKKQSAGSYGFDGGAHYLITNRNIEFRVIGAEISLNKEFGKYMSFRENIPPAEETLVERRSFFGVAGVYTEVIETSRSGKLGLKLGYGRGLYSTSQDSSITDVYDFISPVQYKYLTLIVSYSRKNLTGFAQMISSEKASSIRLGTSYRLGK